MKKLLYLDCGITVVYYVIAIIVFLNFPHKEMSLGMEIASGAVCFIIFPATVIGPLLFVIAKYRGEN